MRAESLGRQTTHLDTPYAFLTPFDFHQSYVSIILSLQDVHNACGFEKKLALGILL